MFRFSPLRIWKILPPNNEKYCHQTFLECKYAKENIKTKNFIDNELKWESDSDNDVDIDNEE